MSDLKMALRNGLIALQEDLDKKKALLIRELISPLMNFERGDVLECENGDRFILNEVKYGVDFNYNPTAFLSGRVLTKKGQPRKDGATITKKYTCVKKVLTK